jgi:RNA polymerase sigma-70 factor, ECF subfamily
MSIRETQLISRARQGDASAFGTLYECYLDDIYRYVYYKVADRFEAEDLTEHVFLKAWQALPRFRIKGATFRAWLYRIAHNAVIDRHRTQKPVVPLDAVPEMNDDAPTPEKAAETGQETDRLAAALAHLKPEWQQVILHRFVNGLSHAETAEVMGIREGHVRVLQHRALKKMKRLMEDVD